MDGHAVYKCRQMEIAITVCAKTYTNSMLNFPRFVHNWPMLYVIYLIILTLAH